MSIQLNGISPGERVQAAREKHAGFERLLKDSLQGDKRYMEVGDRYQDLFRSYVSAHRAAQDLAGMAPEAVQITLPLLSKGFKEVTGKPKLEACLKWTRSPQVNLSEVKEPEEDDFVYVDEPVQEESLPIPLVRLANYSASFTRLHGALPENTFTFSMDASPETVQDFLDLIQKNKPFITVRSDKEAFGLHEFGQRYEMPWLAQQTQPKARSFSLRSASPSNLVSPQDFRKKLEKQTHEKGIQTYEEAVSRIRGSYINCVKQYLPSLS